MTKAIVTKLSDKVGSGTRIVPLYFWPSAAKICITNQKKVYRVSQYGHALSRHTAMMTRLHSQHVNMASMPCQINVTRHSDDGKWPCNSKQSYGVRGVRFAVTGTTRYLLKLT